MREHIFLTRTAIKIMIRELLIPTTTLFKALRRQCYPFFYYARKYYFIIGILNINGFVRSS